jgi:hypothetical protein
MTTNNVPRQRSLTALAAAADGAEDPLDRLRALRALSEETRATVDRSVHDARTEGASWTRIGLSLKISKQAATKRFTPKPTTASATTNPAGGSQPDGSVEATTTHRRLHPWEVRTRSGRLLFVVRPAS